jgi:signal transduction histidine kinase/DNA-binding NarL/FixJ family response regulator
MTAVFVACAVFAALRLAVQFATGMRTPWWGNASGAVAIGLLYLWFRRDPKKRSSPAVHGTAAIATVALLVPAAYGMTSSKWWLALVGFSVLLLGRRREAVLWTVITLILLPLAALLEPEFRVAGASGEGAAERAAAGFAFLAILLGVTWAFRRVAQRRARELTETAASLERANMVKSRFLAHVSHEVRTPLHAVIAMTDMALEGELGAATRQQIETAQQSAKLLLGLLNNILDVARAESDAVELDHRPFVLHEVVSEVLAPVVAQAQRRGLAFTAGADAGVVARRVGDRTRLSQIVLNLVGNALKFTREGSIEVHLSADPTAKERVTLAVKDTGPGIAEDRRDAIFEPFEQVSAADAAVQGGVGLGLAIVRDLAQRMGGGVRLESRVGAGSTFFADLQLAVEEGATEAGPLNLVRTSIPSVAPRAVPRSSRALRTLVCEDNPVNQTVLLAMLRRLGHTATVATDGSEVWEMVQRGVPSDLLITDVEMPRLDGIELTRRIRAREKEQGGRPLPILGATAHVGEAQKHELLAAGMDGYLGKPFTLANLSAAIEEVVGPDVLDLEALGELRQLEKASGVALLDELMVSFRAEATRVTELRAAAAASDKGRVRELAHKLRGSAGVVGASRVRVGAAEIEDQLGALSEAALAARIERLGAEYERAIEALERFLERPAEPALGPPAQADAPRLE